MEVEEQVFQVEPSWMQPLIDYMTRDELPEDQTEPPCKGVYNPRRAITQMKRIRYTTKLCVTRRREGDLTRHPPRNMWTPCGESKVGSQGF